MRAILVATLVLFAALAGCSGKKEGHDHLTYTCTDGKVISEEDYEGVLNDTVSDEDIKSFLKTKCPKPGVGTKTNTTSSVPNKLPVLNINVTDAGGNATMVTMLDGNLTFDATGSSDSDGSISAIAISITDSNTTRTYPLYDAAKKEFNKVKVDFDRPGPVNVSVAMVDDRAGFNGSVFQVYVNHLQSLEGGSLNGPAPHEATGLSHPCRGASDELGDQGPLVDAQYFSSQSIVVVPGATFIEATPEDGSLITICDPEGTAISETKSDEAITSTNTEPLPMPDSGIKNYEIAFYAGTGQQDTAADVIVHYEPREAAAPEA